MSKRKDTLIDRLREWMDLLGKLLSPTMPAPQPIPARGNEKRNKGLKR